MRKTGKRLVSAFIGAALSVSAAIGSLTVGSQAICINDLLKITQSQSCSGGSCITNGSCDLGSLLRSVLSGNGTGCGSNTNSGCIGANCNDRSGNTCTGANCPDNSSNTCTGASCTDKSGSTCIGADCISSSEKPAAQTDAAVSSEVAQVFELVNRERKANGLSELKLSEELCRAAEIRAKEIGGYFSHTRPNGTSCFTVFKENGISYRRAGENIAAGQTSASQVMNGWMNSSGHRANILSGSFGKIGIACYNNGGRKQWVQLFTD